MTTIRQLQEDSFRISTEHGFHEPRVRDGVVRDASHVERLMLIVSEAAEALEELRSGIDPQAVWYSYTAELDHVKFKNLTWDQVEALASETPETLGLVPKPEGYGPELADIVIRVADAAGAAGIDLEEMIDMKQAHNEGREYRHGNKAL